MYLKGLLLLNRIHLFLFRLTTLNTNTLITAITTDEMPKPGIAAGGVAVGICVGVSVGVVAVGVPGVTVGVGVSGAISDGIGGRVGCAVSFVSSGGRVGRGGVVSLGSVVSFPFPFPFSSIGGVVGIAGCADTGIA